MHTMLECVSGAANVLSSAVNAPGTAHAAAARDADASRCLPIIAGLMTASMLLCAALRIVSIPFRRLSVTEVERLLVLSALPDKEGQLY